jgi:hypothetical protein
VLGTPATFVARQDPREELVDHPQPTRAWLALDTDGDAAAVKLGGQLNPKLRLGRPARGALHVEHEHPWRRVAEEHPRRGIAATAG